MRKQKNKQQALELERINQEDILGFKKLMECSNENWKSHEA